MNWQVFCIACIALENLVMGFFWREFLWLHEHECGYYMEKRIILILAILATVAAPFLWGLVL